MMSIRRIIGTVIICSLLLSIPVANTNADSLSSTEFYQEHLLVSNVAWLNASLNGLSDPDSRYSQDYDKAYMVDRNPWTYFLTNTTSTPFTLNISFWFHNPTNCSFIRFYYYYPGNDASYFPTDYSILADGTTIKSGTLSTNINNWTLIDFEDVSVSTLTFQITDVNGGDKVAIAEIEVFSNESNYPVNQTSIPYFEGITDWWNGLDWALTWHIDDVSSASSIPSGWYQHQPLTIQLMTSSPSAPEDPYINTYHCEYGCHADNSPHGGYSYEQAYNYFNTYGTAVESHTTKTSTWSDKCISFAVPYTRANAHYFLAGYDWGFRVIGNNGGVWDGIYPTYPPPTNTYMVVQSPSTFSDSNISVPRNYYDYCEFARQGGKPEVGKYNQSLIEIGKENHSWVDIMMHPGDSFDSSYYSIIENDITGWHATWGEVASYKWHKDHMSVDYNSSASTNTKKVFDIHEYGSDDRIWEVPMTFKFNVPSFQSVRVVWRNNGTVYKDDFPDIGGFYASSSQHTNQTMREGYRFDGTYLYLSTKCSGEKSIEITLSDPSPDIQSDSESFGISLPIDYTATPTPPHHDSDMEYFGMSIPISYSADDNSSGFVIQDSNIPYLTIAGLAVFFPILGLLIYKEKRR